MKEKEEIVKEENKQKTAEITKNSKTRLFIVLIVALISSVIGYILFRGTYLETLEIGEKYITAFWQNVKYMTITLIVNFIIIYSMVYKMPCCRIRQPPESAPLPCRRCPPHADRYQKL